MFCSMIMQPHSPAAAPASPEAETDSHCRAFLNELLEMGMDIARQVHLQATLSKADAAVLVPAPVPDVTVAFDRAARAVRRTIHMIRQFDVAVPVRETANTAQHRAAARRRIIRGVEEAIQRQASEHEADSLRAELLERMDGPDLEDDVGLRSDTDIMVGICRDLGVADQSGWIRRTPADIAILCAHAAKPFAAGVTAPQPEMQMPGAAGLPGFAAASPPGEAWPAAERFFRFAAPPNG
jgi:hypothetical protein